MKQTLEDEIMTGMSRHDLPWGGSISAGGAPVRSMFDDLDADDKVGAVKGEYRRGSYVVHINRYEVGHSLRKVPLPKNRFLRWLTVRRIRAGLGFFSWHYQVNFGGSCCASSACTRSGAIKDCQDWIDEEIIRRKAAHIVDTNSVS